MRMLFWCGCALAVTAATVVYLAADYANDHPDSAIGQGVVQTYRMVTDYNPIVMVGRMAATSRAPAPIVLKEPGCSCTAAADVVAPDGPPEVIDLAGLKFMLCGEECQVQVEETETGSLLFGVGINSDAGLNGGLVDEDPCPANADYYGCPDGAVCPQVVADWVESWGITTAVLGDDSETGAPELLAMPRCLDEMPASEQEQETLDDIYDELLKTPDSAVDVPEGPQQDPYYPVESPSEESDTINPGMAPDCREVPDYHHHYPECPYTGGYCPRQYDYHSYQPPVYQAPVEETPKKVKKVKKHKVEKIDTEVFRVPQHLMIECEGPDCWPGSIQGVDTMECRPADLTEVDPNYPPY